jgi:hypothetical protein
VACLLRQTNSRADKWWARTRTGVEGRRPCHFWVVCPAAETLEWDFDFAGSGIACWGEGEGGSSALAGLSWTWRATAGGARSEEVSVRSEERGVVEHTQGPDRLDRQTDRQTDRQAAAAARAGSGASPRRDWLEWAAGGAGSLRVVGWIWAAGDFVQAWQTSVVSSHNLLPQEPGARSQQPAARTTPEKWAPK